MRYGAAAFDNPKLEAAVYLSGPQNADQVPEEIRKLLDREYVTQVIILRNIDGRECGESFNKISEPT